jgi:hypothetical protein
LACPSPKPVMALDFIYGRQQDNRNSPTSRSAP